MLEYCLLKGNHECTVFLLKYYNRCNYDELKLALNRNKEIFDMVLERFTEPIPRELLEIGLQNDLDVGSLLLKVKPTIKALHVAISKGKEDVALDFITNYPKLHRKLDPITGQSALHLAAFHGLTNLAASLVKSSSNPCEYINLLDKQGFSAVLIAEIRKFRYISELLRDLH